MSPLEAAIARLTEEIKRQQDTEVRARLEKAAVKAGHILEGEDTWQEIRDVILDELSKEGFPTG
jgi:hypothetical protein